MSQAAEGLTDEYGYPIADRPHPMAVFDLMWRSRHSPKPIDGWVFAYRCASGCPDAVATMPVTRGAENHPKDCPDCGGPVELYIPEEEW